MATEPPRAYFKSITEYGLVKLGFTEDVWRVPNMTMINNGTIYLSDLELIGNNFKRELSTLSFEAQDYPVL